MKSPIKIQKKGEKPAKQSNAPATTQSTNGFGPTPAQTVAAANAIAYPHAAFSDNAETAVAGAACIVSDAWVSMGDDNATKRHNLLRPFQVKTVLLACASNMRKE